MKIVLHNWDYGHLKKGDIVRICWKFSECIKDYRSLHSASFFTLSPVNNTRGHSAKIQKNHCSLDIRRHFFSQSCKSLELFTPTRHRLGKHQYFQERSAQDEKRFDGLLYGLIGPSGPTASHALRILRTGAAAPGKSPGKSQ